jgi:hypothetical protein
LIRELGQATETPLQVYAYFVLPFVVLGLGVVAYWWSGRETQAR